VRHGLPPQFEIVDYDHGPAPGITVRGEIDIATGPQLELALDKAIRESTGAFVVDLCELEFLDSSGVGVLLRARAWLVGEARPLVIVCPPGAV
jgi:anti-sigma B factor antagonist